MSTVLASAVSRFRPVCVTQALPFARAWNDVLAEIVSDDVEQKYGAFRALA
jgi:hypothetical protein